MPRDIMTKLDRRPCHAVDTRQHVTNAAVMLGTVLAILLTLAAAAG